MLSAGIEPTGMILHNINSKWKSKFPRMASWIYLDFCDQRVVMTSLSRASRKVEAVSGRQTSATPTKTNLKQAWGSGSENLRTAGSGSRYTDLDYTFSEQTFPTLFFLEIFSLFADLTLIRSLWTQCTIFLVIKKGYSLSFKTPVFFRQWLVLLARIVG